MDCPRAHEWFEFQRGAASREDAERLRRHLAQCPDCRTLADEARDVAASLERLAGASRMDMSADGAEALFRRVRCRGLLGREPRQPLSVRLGRVRWIRPAVAAAVTVAAVLVVAIGLSLSTPEDVQPRGALQHLVRAAHGIHRAESLRRLAPAARAAVTEELARPDPSTVQVSDLLMVAYICARPREDRQARDVDFLLAGIWKRHRPTPVAGVVLVDEPAWPTLLPRAVADSVAGDLLGSPAAAADPLVVARAHLLAGDYRDALRALPSDGRGAVLRAWCLESLGRPGEGLQALADAEALDDAGLARVMKANLALAAQDVAEALRQYETLASENDRYWFPAGYLCRYELRDAGGAGWRFAQVKDAPLAAYVSQEFKGELAAVRLAGPTPLFAEDFEEYELGHPADWALVMTRGGEFSVVDVPGGRALSQDEVRYQGAEFLCGGPDWNDYTLKVDFKVMATQGEYAVGAAVYRHSDDSGYVLEASPGRLRIIKQFASRERSSSRKGPYERLLLEPVQAQMRLDQPPAEGWWYTLKVRVQKVDGGVNVAGKMWRSEMAEPLGWQVVWTDTGQAGLGTLSGGAAGVQISKARVLVDNLSVTRNPMSDALLSGAP
jgi:hypothetical protein